MEVSLWEGKQEGDWAERLWYYCEQRLELVKERLAWISHGVTTREIIGDMTYCRFVALKEEQIGYPSLFAFLACMGHLLYSSQFLRIVFESRNKDKEALVTFRSIHWNFPHLHVVLGCIGACHYLYSWYNMIPLLNPPLLWHQLVTRLVTTAMYVFTLSHLWMTLPGDVNDPWIPKAASDTSSLISVMPPKREVTGS